MIVSENCKFKLTGTTQFFSHDQLSSSFSQNDFVLLISSLRQKLFLALLSQSTAFHVLATFEALFYKFLGYLFINSCIFHIFINRTLLLSLVNLISDKNFWNSSTNSLGELRLPLNKS
jgi:hypothetical protein